MYGESEESSQGLAGCSLQAVVRLHVNGNNYTERGDCEFQSSQISPDWGTTCRLLIK